MAFLEYKPTQTLFQYCSLDLFFSIISSRELWFSDLASSNDPRDLRLGYDNVFHALNLARLNSQGTLVARLVELLEKRLVPYYRNVNVFCSCFSLAGDELPMWGSYGSEYSGVSIGFRPTAVVDVTAIDQFTVLINHISVRLGENGRVRGYQGYLSSTPITCRLKRSPNRSKISSMGHNAGPFLDALRTATPGANAPRVVTAAKSP